MSQVSTEREPGRNASEGNEPRDNNNRVPTSSNRMEGNSRQSLMGESAREPGGV